MGMTSLVDQVGFDYAQTVRKLNQIFTYEQIAKSVGYKNVNSVARIMNGAIPSHIHGEALWALYIDTFGAKPLFHIPKYKTVPVVSLSSGP